MRQLKGFTLVELLVTISIIAVLASIVFVSFGDSRTNARNKAMTVELKEVQLALETYRAQNSTYPQPESGCGSAPAGQLLSRSDGPSSWCDNNYFNTSMAAQDPLFVPEFITQIPVGSDSFNSDCVIEYRTADDGSWYKLTAINCLAGVDVNTGIGPEEPLARCAISCAQGVSGDTCYPDDADYYQSFAVYSLGGQCE